ncbi:LOW QUALITY PROTEIN: hypothetical protein PanWU01x14_264800 [Parasponia andersonii]|uniref:Uncharacterized protein n=1 Tax=Parasponia andersonii TaxID=3476 RepID=A0A2P5B7B6_PARAD|nr:LOW QUALITY PROTEIN: hypothetical protein PanWU01x14_264800 [Parasponia andersonii]
MGSHRCRSSRLGRPVNEETHGATCFVPLATSNLLHRYNMTTSELVNGYIGWRGGV